MLPSLARLKNTVSFLIFCNFLAFAYLIAPWQGYVGLIFTDMYLHYEQGLGIVAHCKLLVQVYMLY